MFVMLGELKVPVQFASVRIKRKQTVAIQIVSGATLPPVRRRGIAGRPEQLVRRGVVNSGHPCRSTTDFPGACLPGIVSLLSWTGNRVEPPFALASLGIVSVDEAAYPILSTRDAHDNLVFHRERRQRKAVAFAVIRRRNIPDQVSRLRIKSKHVRVEGSHEDFVAQNREPTIYPSATRPDITRQLALIKPQRTSRARIERKSPIIRTGRIQHAINHQWRSFELAGGYRLINPLRDHGMHICGSNLIERAEAAAGIVTRISKPILWLFGRVH